jgi:glycosyltransferase involved in cell wall biosynthesis
MKMSLIIPCYNEAQSLSELVRRVERAFTDTSTEVIFVDNGSTDNTAEIFKTLASCGAEIWKVVRVEENQGYGAGILAGLREASGEILAWTHADLQTDPADTIQGLQLFKSCSDPKKLFVKGLRQGRPLLDVLFTAGMSAFETILLRSPMRDINAQPTMFHRDFLASLKNAPTDFSLDLFAYWKAIKNGYLIRRFPVNFGPRKFGSSHWNSGLMARYKFIKRTVIFSISLLRNAE